MIEIDWSKLVSLDYWLEGIAGTSAVTPVIPKDSPFFWFFLYLFSGFIVAGILILLIKAFIHSEHPMQNKLPFLGNNFIWMGILGLVWFTMRETSVSFLGARIWLIFGLIWFLFVLIYFVRYLVFFYRLEIAYFRKKISGQVS